MTFQLGVWFAEKPLSLGAAGELFDKIVENKDIDLRPQPSMKAFFNHLLNRYPTLDLWPNENVTECPWSEQPRFNPQYLLFTLMPAHAETLEAVIIDMAIDNGLTVYDPQTPDLHMPPALEDQTFWRLEAGDVESVDPDAEQIERALSDLRDDGESYVLLAECASAYIQAALDAGEYVLEYRDKQSGDVFQAITREVAELQRIFISYREGNGAWRKAVKWEAVE
jgi:hypothetical protein